MRYKTPTLKEKVKMYESFLHKINTGIVCCDNEMIKELIGNADNWSYAHRKGNGMCSEREQQHYINANFYRLLDTPISDAATKERQRRYSEQQEAEKI